MAVTDLPMPYGIAHVLIQKTANRWNDPGKKRMSTYDRTRFQQWRQAWYEEFGRLYGKPPFIAAW